MRATRSLYRPVLRMFTKRSAAATVVKNAASVSPRGFTCGALKGVCMLLHDARTAGRPYEWRASRPECCGRAGARLRWTSGPRFHGGAAGPQLPEEGFQPGVLALHAPCCGNRPGERAVERRLVESALLPVLRAREGDERV